MVSVKLTQDMLCCWVWHEGSQNHAGFAWHAAAEPLLHNLTAGSMNLLPQRPALHGTC
jgi:hypothetical protein